MIWIPLDAAVLAFAVVATVVAICFVRRHGVAHILYRAATGHHLHGQHVTNRGWISWGTRPASGTLAARHTRWSRRPRLHRALAFWAAVLGLPYLVIGWYAAHGLTVASAQAALGITAAWLAFRAARWAAHRGHRRHVIMPVAVALAGHLSLSASVAAENLRIAKNPEAAKAGQRIARIRRLPDTYAASESDRTWVEDLLRSRIPVDMNFRWVTTKHPMEMIAVCAASPPKEVAVADYAEFIDTLAYGQYFLGVSASGREVWDANEEDPHLINCARTRRGKTNTNLAIAAQALRRGEAVTAVDPKRVSMTVLSGVPGFTLASDPRDVGGMWRVIRDFREEMDAAIDGRPVLDAYGRPRPHTLILEEANQLFALFRERWELIKEPGQRVTDVPAWRDVKAVLHQGAQFGYRVVVDGQDLTQQVMFGMRASFGTILVTGYTQPQYRYVTGQSANIPPSPTRRGRFMLIRGADAIQVQVVAADPKRGKEHNELAWREFALGGRQVAGGPSSAWTYKAEKAARKVRGALPMRRPQPLAIPMVLTGLAEGAAYLGMKPDAFRKARQRHAIPGEFTTDHRGKGTQPAWHRDTLDAWAAGLPGRDRALGQDPGTAA